MATSKCAVCTILSVIVATAFIHFFFLELLLILGGSYFVRDVINRCILSYYGATFITDWSWGYYWVVQYVRNCTAGNSTASGKKSIGDI